jgi:hypothetical protein
MSVGPLLCGVTGGAHPEGAPPAEYVWTHDFPPGPLRDMETPLCAEHCAIWRADAEQFPELTPKRIRSIPRSVISIAPEGSDPSDPDAWTPIGYADGVRIKWGSP